MDVFENYLQGKISFEEVIAATEHVLHQKIVEQEDVSSAMQKMLHRLQGLKAATDACVDEDSDVIFIDMYGGNASFKEV